MSDKAFLDTNILIYATAQEDNRTVRSRELMLAGGVISVQMLNEFVNVAIRKLKMPWDKVEETVAAICAVLPSATPLTVETHREAVRIARRYGFRFYDALMVAAALEASCTVLYSEDLQHGQVIDGVLTGSNPFRES